MKLLLRIPDELADAYEAMATRNGGGQASLEEILVAQLEKFKTVHAMDRVVVVGSKARDELEALFGGDQLKGDIDLLNRVKELANIQIGDVRVEWSPTQLAELKRYASRNERSVQQVITDVVTQLSGQFFWNM